MTDMLENTFESHQHSSTDWASTGNVDNNFALDPSSHQAGQVNIDNFLADLGFGNQGPQSTFDNLFLNPLPDFPVDAWSWD